MVGTATVTEQVNGQTGQVRYGGLDWPARSPGQTIATGTRVNVSGLFNDGVWVYPRHAVGHGATGPGRQAAVQLPQRVTWREASAAQGKLSGGYLLTPEESVRLLQLVVARRQANDRLFNRIFASVIGLLCAFLLVVGAIALPSSIAAAGGEGVRGVFTAQSFIFAKITWWTGTFRSDSGQVETDVSYSDRPPSGTRPGSSFPAIYRDGAAYAVHGSTTWLQFVFFMILAAGALVVIIWRGPIRALKRHRDLQQTRAGRGGNSLDQAPAS